MNHKIKPIIIIIIILLLMTQSVYSLNIKEKINQKNLFHIEFIEERFFLWSQPKIIAPENGYPVIFLLHGASQHAFSWFIYLNSWNENQISFTEQALKEGYFIISLESHRPIWPGPRAWDIFNNNYSENNDFQYIFNVISWIETRTLNIDSNNLFCAGFSSGAFMCSKLAITFDYIFNAIAINSGCNAESITLTNKGPIFNTTASYNLSQNHPPTIILHGELDRFVPVGCAINYYSDMQKEEIDTKLIIDENKGHIWLKNYNEEIIQWFNKYLE